MSIVRPALIMGVSDMPGRVAPTGWSNKGNLNYPMCYYYFTGQPDPKTKPKLRYLPARYCLDRGGGICDPVDPEPGTVTPWAPARLGSLYWGPRGRSGSWKECFRNFQEDCGHFRKLHISFRKLPEPSKKFPESSRKLP